MSSLIVVHPRFEAFGPLQPITSTHCGRHRGKLNSYVLSPATNETSVRLPHNPLRLNGSHVLVHP